MYILLKLFLGGEGGTTEFSQFFGVGGANLNSKNSCWGQGMLEHLRNLGVLLIVL